MGKDTSGVEDPHTLLSQTCTLLMNRTSSSKNQHRVGASNISMVNQSKSHDISIVSSKFEDEIKELREQNTVLESKNKKYLDIIGMTASEQ